MLRITPDMLDHLERHHGIITASALRPLGYSATAVKKLVRHGVLELVLPGAYHQRGRPLTTHGRWAAVCAAHPSLVIAGPSAGRLWQFRRVPVEARVASLGELVEPVHVIAPPASNPTVERWVKVYRTSAIEPSRDVHVRSDGIRVTGRARTALDLARWVGGVDLVSIIEQAMRDGALDIEAMRAVAVDWRSPRRRWIDDYLRALDRVLPGRAADSHLEVLLGNGLAAAGVTGLVRQFAIDLDGFGRVRFDLAVPVSRWAIEVDGHPTHHDASGRRRDEARDRAAQRHGWTVTRIGPDAFGDALPATIDRLVALARRLQPSVR